jgi:hypothetical protein
MADKAFTRCDHNECTGLAPERNSVMTTKKVNERNSAVCRLDNAIRILNECGDVEIGAAIAQIAVALNTLGSAVVDVDWENIGCITKAGRYGLCAVCPEVAECHRAAESETGLDQDDDFESFWAKEGDCFGMHPPKGLWVPECYQMCLREDACKAETSRRASLGGAAGLLPEVSHKDETHSSHPEAESKSKKLLKFTCPACRSNRLAEVVLMRQEIEGLLDPEDPDYNWMRHGDDLVVFGGPGSIYTWPKDYNYYRCFKCDAELEDDDGRPFWEPERLYEWLLKHQELEESLEEEEG